MKRKPRQKRSSDALRFLPQIIFHGSIHDKYGPTNSVKVEIQDERTTGQNIEVSFRGELRPEQRDAIEQVLAHDQGILCAPTAFGKTVVGASLIAARAVNTLILVHRRQLMDQWRERLAAFLVLPIENIGQLSGGKTKRNGLIDVAVIQSLQHKGAVEDFVADYGHVIVDECHHLSAVTFERVLREIKAKYVLGLTATPNRKDGHQPIIYMQCGLIRFYLSAKKAAESSPLQHKVFPRFTNFTWNRSENETTIQDIYAALFTHQERNDAIIRDLQQALSVGRSPLVLTSRTEHLDYTRSTISDRSRSPTPFLPRKHQRIYSQICFLARNGLKLHQTCLILMPTVLRCGIAAFEAVTRP